MLSISLSLIAVFAPLIFYGRHRRPPVPRIRADAVGRDDDLARRFADDDADDVRAHSAARTAHPPRPPLSRDASASSTRCSPSIERRLRIALCAIPAS